MISFKSDEKWPGRDFNFDRRWFSASSFGDFPLNGSFKEES
jgi:hypothetical protein